jgi:hypothetical protein
MEVGSNLVLELRKLEVRVEREGNLSVLHWLKLRHPMSMLLSAMEQQ